ncbi:XdhC family protein [Parasphingopyxis lamellibrachiae]|uniref:Xanthine dehydrogenase accessory factor n=1 Tax=Parasphingopyxis lamellibrachiae TaxID=680125 RepID=A0A3D9FFC3_9SPHN|nr:XdhC family protein [Parasphingopyxis lamellibrachiae]RED15796.1 xanthine dehydrogenase accessory factor [Parasphingopyxis lamellibrachiae]
MKGEMDRLIARQREWRGDRLAVATVLRTWNSAPRPVGSHMLVHEDGRFEGSVSGGCVEGEILLAAAQVISENRFRILDYGVENETAWEIGLPCGGQLRVMIQPVGMTGFPEALFAEIAAARAAGETLSTATDLETGMTRLAEPANDDLWIAHYAPRRRLLIIGAVQIAQSLARIARELDIEPVIIDPRERFLTAERFPGMTRDDRWPDDAIAEHRPDRRTAIAALSHDPKIDDPALVAALATPAAYIAALGSRQSHAARLNRLRAQGIGDEMLQRIDGPAGLDIGSTGPAEIALSIAAAMVKAFAQSSP